MSSFKSFLSQTSPLFPGNIALEILLCDPSERKCEILEFLSPNLNNAEECVSILQISYSQLHEIVEKIARIFHFLSSKFPRKIVGLLMSEAPDSIFLQLGALRAGWAFVPIDPTFPPDRIEFVFQDALCQFVIYPSTSFDPEVKLTRKEIKKFSIDQFLENESVDLLPPVNEELVCHYIYTSGSTGRPKGVTCQLHQVR